MDFCGEYFLSFGLTDFMLFLVLAWRYGFFFSLSKILSAFFTRSLGMGLASSHDDLIFQNRFFLFPISADGRRGLFPLWDSSQSFGFYLLPSPVRRFVRATICPWTSFFTHPVTKYKHLLVSIMTGFVTSGLTYIINSLNGHSLTAW